MEPEQLMDAGKKLLKSKSQDYTTISRYQNFTRQAEISSWFVDEQDKVFANMIAVKVARLAALLGRKEPNHESIEDTFIDLINYSALWGGYHSSKGDKK